MQYDAHRFFARSILFLARRCHTRDMRCRRSEEAKLQKPAASVISLVSSTNQSSRTSNKLTRWSSFISHEMQKTCFFRAVYDDPIGSDFISLQSLAYSMNISSIISFHLRKSSQIVYF